MKIKRAVAMMICFTMLLLTGCNATEHLDPDRPTTINIWHYYNGEQEKAFNALVDSFNHTIGAEKGIIVEPSNYGGVAELRESVLDSANEKVGSDELPNIFMSYADTAYEVDKLGKVLSLNEYFSERELAALVPNYLEEGFLGDDELKIFPIAKSTEVLMINQSRWQSFAKATGAKLEDLETIEGVTKTAEAYYEYTDGLTSETDDGEAFFGRDAVANYIIIGAMQLGNQIISVDKDGWMEINFDEEVARKLWDNYYVPYINGYFMSKGRFRSDDVKMGNIIACVCSTSGASYFPDEVVSNDDDSVKIDIIALKAPMFEDGEAYAVQQGAGLVVTEGTEAENEAAVEFIKWFTAKEQNVKFSVESGYMPVLEESNDFDTITSSAEIENNKIEQVIKIALDTIENSQMYTADVGENSGSVRVFLEDCLTDKVTADRAEVVSLMESGISRTQAVARFDTDENFRKWYNETCKSLNEAAEQGK